MFVRKPNPTLTLIQGQRNSCNLSLYLLGSLSPPSLSLTHTHRVFPLSTPVFLISTLFCVRDDDHYRCRKSPRRDVAAVAVEERVISFHHSKYLYECGSSIFIQEHLPSVGSYPLKRILVFLCVFPHSHQSWIIWSWTSRVLMCNMCLVIRKHSLFPVCCDCVSCRLKGSVCVLTLKSIRGLWAI